MERCRLRQGYDVEHDGTTGSSLDTDYILLISPPIARDVGAWGCMGRDCLVVLALGKVALILGARRASFIRATLTSTF
jgi:hypothetical protein